MKICAVYAVILLGIGSAVAQTPPDSKDTIKSAPIENDMRDAAAIQIELLTRQNSFLSQIISQYQRGLVTYPIAMPLPGPITCQKDCRGTVATICHAVKYPSSYIYPAYVPATTFGDYVNGVCYGP